MRCQCRLCPSPSMSLYFLSPVWLITLVSSDTVPSCGPYISEISSLTISNTKELQFIELQVSEECRVDRKTMRDLLLSDYGLVVLNTKLKEKGDHLTFEVKTFVKFARFLWPKQHREENARRGGRRIPDIFKAFFVVGGPAALAPFVEPSDRVDKAITWDIYTTDVGGKCGPLIN